MNKTARLRLSILLNSVGGIFSNGHGAERYCRKYSLKITFRLYTMKTVQKILEKVLGDMTWNITRPKEGWEKNVYIARSEGDKSYIVKFGVNPEVMKRLSDLGVTPQVIATGLEQGKTYMIQAYVATPFVSRKYLSNNLQTLANAISIYHNDSILKNILLRTLPKDHLSISGELSSFQSSFSALSPKCQFSKIAIGIKEIQKRYSMLSDTLLTPVHDDPNTKNIFLTKKGLQFIDWNKIRLSDPLSDIGALLWWYVPPEKWGKFFRHYDISLTDSLLERIYLAAAKMSLGFTLWYLEHNPSGYEAAYGDFTTALSHGENLRAWFKT